MSRAGAIDGTAATAGRTATATPTPLEKVLDPDELLIWSGRPSRRILVADDVSPMFLGLALLGAGWGMLDDFLNRSAPSPVSWAGAAGVCVGAYLLVARPLIDCRRRRRTWYGLTQRRAIVVEGETLAWFTPRGVMNLRLHEWPGTIEFRGLCDESLIPARLRGFRNLRGGDAREAHRLIASRVAARIVDIGAPAPVAATAETRPASGAAKREASCTCEARPDGATLAYHEPFGAVLEAGERKIWVGRPKRWLFFSRRDAAAAAIALIWTIAWGVRAFDRLGWTGYRTFAIPGLFAAACCLSGVLFLYVRVAYPVLCRRGHWYAITERRCIWERHDLPPEASSIVRSDVCGVMVERHGDGTGTIAFALRYPLPARFEHVDDPAGVHAIVADWLRAATPAALR